MYSIDEFLEHRPEFADIGKGAIARALIQYESPESLYSDDDNWYRHLFHQMRASSLKEFAKNRVTFVTFNYDRSLEHFLYTAAANLWGAQPQEVAEVICGFPIFHVHGRLGSLPWQVHRKIWPWLVTANGEQSMRSYEPAVTPENIRRAVGELSVIHEKTQAELLKHIRKAILASARVFVLGLSYHPTAMEKLDFPVANISVFGTCMGLTQLERLEINYLYDVNFREEPDMANCDILAFLRRHVRLSQQKS